MITESVSAISRQIRELFAGNTAADRWGRSGVGLVLTLVLLPVLLGVLACLPVPVGDPEKSHVDPAMSGAWRLSDSDGGQMLMVLDPYDKRTWLMSLISLGAAVDSAAAGESETPPQVPFDAANADGFKVKGMSLHKCWLTSIEGETFMTWESKTLSETLPGMVPESWWVFRVRKSGADAFYLDSFDYAIDGLGEVKTRKQAEQIIRRHLDDPGFFKVDGAPRLERLPESDLEALSRLLKDFGLEDTL